MNWFKSIFKRKEKFILPQRGDKVGFSDKIIKEGLPADHCFEVVSSIGDEECNLIHLHCSTVLKTGEWKILPKETPIKA